ncbi:ubiquitin carboxyl-terminal hydrolase 1 isoform X2 [Brienomyrus brachyistius]|uniref:ubiquitin carboxyl-terminal hydrolase 1 isoform X2 n=1 Tax=Brienomyrus brachyistius TaxID=42636 RepID=UPI0020B185F2|nr:ubiquitin carboxyl-terminal hydrolase 1 isoform X2 [Brienomyrus brachyistius]
MLLWRLGEAARSAAAGTEQKIVKTVSQKAAYSFLKAVFKRLHENVYLLALLGSVAEHERKMTGLHGEGGPAAVGSPVKKNRLSLKFFQKKDTKRTLDFSESRTEEQKPPEQDEADSCDQVVPGPTPAPLTCENRENLVPFVGLNNLGNTCYLNSILQVLYYCPGFKDAIKVLYNLSKKKEKPKQDADNEQEGAEEAIPMNIELLGSFHSLIISMEQLQSSFLLNPKKYSDGELAIPPRRLLNTLRQLNPMYEGYLQHDAQEVLRCILGYIQEACESIQKEHEMTSQPQDLEADCPGSKMEEERHATTEETLNAGEAWVNCGQEGNAENQIPRKRKSDTEAGNARKKSKSIQVKSETEEPLHFTRSKRRTSGDISIEHTQDGIEGAGDLESSKVTTRRQKRPRLSWLKPSGKQTSIFSKFRLRGRISSHVGSNTKQEKGDSSLPEKDKDAVGAWGEDEKLQSMKIKSQSKENSCFDLMEHLFQGQLVLRTRCLECECFTERREDFQDISVPVQEDEPCRLEDDSEVSPDPKQESKTLKWALSQFASVERIVGEDKYFCETCHHYTEAERSLLFDKTPEVVTIHLKCFAANSSEIDPYAGLSKVNTPLHTPLRLSLEEWCTQPSKEYELFAVVMHSGVTISSGHYTTYVKMMDLKDMKVELDEGPRADSPNAVAPAYRERNYDDGEVSFSLSGKANVTTGKIGAKKPTDGVGLLGGQKSVSSFELGSKQANPDKAGSVMGECTKGEPRSAQGHQAGVKCEDESRDTSEADVVSMETSKDLAQHNLMGYEGKWMLFDDSEVRLFEEKDFLNGCSPETCTTSTPYLLFYKKVQE